MTTRRQFVLLAGMALLFGNLPLQAQDDMYAHVRFTNESDKPVKIKVWNTRSELGKFEATVEAGKSTDLTGKDGKPLLVGLGSSRIQINEMEPKPVFDVANRGKDAMVITWTKDGFKPPAKE
jgi:hypothetical protein